MQIESRVGMVVAKTSYHSGLHAKERSLVQELFCSNKIRVVVATVAFGMGLDKSDVEGVRQQNLNTPYSIASCFIGKLVGVSHHTGNLVGKLILILWLTFDRELKIKEKRKSLVDNLCCRGLD
ncbi:ATP-dependent DNA helicase Q-like 5 [Carex littledalei]|uniref:DNA 3'-5' helicase n=1 Tax=Carex littledalei TaxID=544730 RepID=A0A833QFU1_9POAL|nr:ATP-dependent DNA helicase Q-like 5 [Carex littledalei]